MHATCFRGVLGLAACLWPVLSVSAQLPEAAAVGAVYAVDESLPGEPHAHQPVEIDSRPMVTRLDVPLLRPRRLLVESDGRIVVADWAAGTVVEVDPEGRHSLLATGLHEPAGLARDPFGVVYVSTHAGGMTGAGGIHRLIPGDDPQPLVDGLTGPTDLAFGPDGYLYVACFHEDSILKVGPDGGMAMIVATVPAPAALAFDPAGVLHVASSTDGALFRITSMGEVEIVTRDLHVPSDLAFDPEGHLIVANYGTKELSYVGPFGRLQKFAIVPEGTIAIDFDPDGNLLFVNWDGQYLMKVTTQLTVPCPHCGQPIPVRLREVQPPGGAPPAESPLLSRPVI